MPKSSRTFSGHHLGAVSGKWIEGETQEGELSAREVISPSPCMEKDRIGPEAQRMR